jgi:hypothetical protein
MKRVIVASLLCLVVSDANAETVCYPVHDRYTSGQIVICREMGWAQRMWRCNIWRENCRWRQ